MSDQYPRRTPAQAEGELGVAIFAVVIRETLGWEFRRTPQEVDFGVDGYLDVVSESGEVTGKTIAVQIKSGASYFHSSSSDSWTFRGERKHINYYTNIDVPLILVLVDTQYRKIWWQRFEAYETDGSAKGWSLRIPKSHVLTSESKPELEVIAGTPKDHLSHLDEVWTMHEKAKENDILLFVISRKEIETSNTSVFSSMLRRFKATREALIDVRNKVEFSISGYGDDPRELYEIPQVRTWFKKMVQDVECLIYFIYFGPKGQAFSTTVYCVCDARRVSATEVEFPDRDVVLGFINHQYARLNKFTESYDLEEFNRSISETFAARIKQILIGGADAAANTTRKGPNRK